MIMISPGIVDPCGPFGISFWPIDLQMDLELLLLLEHVHLDPCLGQSLIWINRNTTGETVIAEACTWNLEFHLEGLLA